MGGPSQTQQTQQQQKVELPAWVNDAAMANYQQASQVADRPLQQYGGPDVAAESPLTTQARGLLTSSVGQTQPLYGEAANLQRSSAGPLDIPTYLNPYTNEVEQRAIGNANTSLTQQLRDIATGATKAGAFGGSRFGVQSGVAQAQGVKNIGDLSATLRSQGFDTAAALAQQEKARQSGAAQGLLSTAQGQQAATGTDIAGLFSGGQQQQGYQQSLIDALKNRFQTAWNYPVEQLNLKLAALGMTPYGKTTTGTGTTETSTTPDWATLALGGAFALPGLMKMSDRRAKTDIKKLTNGEIPIYSYRYKDDPKTYPKVVGPMAQDIEKKYPSAVKKVGRYKTIDINNLMEVLS